MTPREALTQRIRRLREHRDRLQAKALQVTSEINGLIAQRDALTDADAAKIDALQVSGVVRLED